MLTGKVNLPSGHLPITCPADLSQTPGSELPGTEVGYRWYARTDAQADVRVRAWPQLHDLRPRRPLGPRFGSPVNPVSRLFVVAALALGARDRTRTRFLRQAGSPERVR